MAHYLIDFETVSDEICTVALNDNGFPSNEEPPVTLTEVYHNGKMINSSITEELLRSYIENDFQNASQKTLIPSTPRCNAIKLIHSIRRERLQDGRLLPVPLSGYLLRRLAPWVRMPMVFPQVLAAGTAMFLDAIPLVPESKLRTPKEIRMENLCFVLQFVPGGVWSSCFGASFTYNFKSRCMYIFLQTYETVDAKSFSEIIDMGRFGASGLSPFLLPSAIVKAHLETRVLSLDEKKNEIFQLECSMGVRKDYLTNVDVRTLDYTALSRAINSLNSNLAWTAHSCKRTDRLLYFMDSVTIRYRALAIENGVPDDEAFEVEQSLLDAHAYLSSWNQGLADRVEYLSKRLQALSQSVYSGIAQRDSANSLSIGRTSTKLAETSQQVAIATSRDSAVMRVITAVTIIFLPGTFTATFFSTTFFNFGAGTNGHVFSPWIWLYFVLTLALTAIVISGTWILWRSKEKEITVHLDKSKVDTDE